MSFVRLPGGIVRGNAPSWLYKLMERPTLGRAMRIGPEDALAIAFGERCRYLTLTGKLKGCWTHIPHEVGGGTKNAGLRYALAKAMGLVAGSADYVFTRPGGALWLEAKKPKDTTAAGRLNPAQRMFRQWAEGEGVPYATFTSVSEAMALLHEFGFLENTWSGE